MSRFKIKPNIFRIMHPFEGGPLDVISAQAYFDLEDKYLKAVDSLIKIKNMDYRGNRSSESVIAFNILKELGE